MFQNINKNYTWTDATIEILVMLMWAFLIGFVLAWIVKPNQTKAKSSKKVKKSTKAPLAIQVEDDLQLIEGIWPKIESHLRSHGVVNYKDIVKQDVFWLEDILEQWWKRLAAHSPATWPDQARLAMEAKWSELEEYQSILNTGRKK